MDCFEGISLVQLDQLIIYSRYFWKTKQRLKKNKSETFDKLNHKFDVFILLGEIFDKILSKIEGLFVLRV